LIGFNEAKRMFGDQQKSQYPVETQLHLHLSVKTQYSSGRKRMPSPPKIATVFDDITPWLTDRGLSVTCTFSLLPKIQFFFRINLGVTDSN
jgi:hypothetical protein